MARRKRRSPKPPSAPPPRYGAPGGGSKRQRGSSSSVQELQPVVEAMSAEELDTQYSYVRRDLLRIALWAVVLFALILASRYVIPLA